MNDYDLKRVAKAEKALFAKLCAKTNGDIMRAKTDEELAEWLTMIEKRVIKNALSKPFMYTDEQLKADWLDWLRQEDDDGESVY